VPVQAAAEQRAAFGLAIDMVGGAVGVGEGWLGCGIVLFSQATKALSL
jgi:hypothetical protein